MRNRAEQPGDEWPPVIEKGSVQNLSPLRHISKTPYYFLKKMKFHLYAAIGLSFPIYRMGSLGDFRIRARRVGLFISFKVTQASDFEIYRIIRVY